MTFKTAFEPCTRTAHRTISTACAQKTQARRRIHESTSCSQSSTFQHTPLSLLLRALHTCCIAAPHPTEYRCVCAIAIVICSRVCVTFFFWVSGQRRECKGRATSNVCVEKSPDDNFPRLPFGSLCVCPPCFGKSRLKKSDLIRVGVFSCVLHGVGTSR